MEESVVHGIEFSSMLGAVATIETEETRINDNAQKYNVLSKCLWLQETHKFCKNEQYINEILSTQFFLCNFYIYIGKFIQL